MILNNLVKGLSGGELEGRCVLLSALMLSLSVHLSGFSPVHSAAVILASAYFSSGRSLRLITAFLPFILLVLLSGVFFSLKYAASSALAFAAVVSTGALIYSSNVSEIGGAMVFFRIPERFVAVVQVAVAVVPVLASDLMEIWSVTEGRGMRRYSKAMKAFISTAVLRALSLSEAMYSKSFNYRAVYTLRRPDARSVITLSVSVLLFLSTLLPAPPFWL